MSAATHDAAMVILGTQNPHNPQAMEFRVTSLSGEIHEMIYAYGIEGAMNVASVSRLFSHAHVCESLEEARAWATSQGHLDGEIQEFIFPYEFFPLRRPRPTLRRGRATHG